MNTLNRKEYLDKATEASQFAADVIGNTMTSVGKYVSLPDNVTTNDGVTIVRNISFDDETKQAVINKLRAAAAKTDELAGDGTSATTILTNKLLQVIKENQDKNYMTIEQELNEWETLMLEGIAKQVKKLETEQDYINLATVSTKDKELGKLIGSAFFKAGENSIIKMRPAKGEEDSVETEGGYMVLSSTKGYALPEQLRNSKIIFINEAVASETEGLRQLVIKAMKENNGDLLIVTTEMGEIAMKYIISVNQMNADKNCRISLMQIPAGNSYVNSMELMLDLQAVVGGEIYQMDTATRKMLDGQSLSYGYSDNIEVYEHGTFFFNKEKLASVDERIAKLNKDIEEAGRHPEKIEVLRQRINLLKSETLYLNIYAQTQVELETKRLRIEDAIKSTQFTSTKGYLPGAGKALKIANDNVSPENIFKFSGNVVAEQILSMINGLEEKMELTHEQNNMLVPIINDDYTYTFADPEEKGIIDSYVVIQNVIKNAVSIARDINKVHYKFYFEKAGA